MGEDEGKVARGLTWLLKGGISAFAIFWVMRKVDFAGAWGQARHIDAGWLLAALLLLTVQLGVGAARWAVVLRALGGVFAFRRTLAVYYMGAFFTQVATIGGDAIRMLFSRRSGLSLATAVNSVLLERVVTVFGLIVLVAGTEPLLLHRSSAIPGAWVFPALVVAGGAGIAVLGLLDRLPAALSRWRLVRGLGHLAGDTRRLFLHPGWGPASLGMAILGHVNLTLGLWALARGLHLPVDALDCVVLFPPVILVTTLPISIGGLGVREAAMATLFGFVGVPHDSAVVLSLVFFATSVVTALPGGMVFLLSGERRADARPADVGSATSVGG